VLGRLLFVYSDLESCSRCGRPPAHTLDSIVLFVDFIFQPIDLAILPINLAVLSVDFGILRMDFSVVYSRRSVYCCKQLCRLFVQLIRLLLQLLVVVAFEGEVESNHSEKERQVRIGPSRAGDFGGCFGGCRE
jgi:hypothetical protein